MAGLICLLLMITLSSPFTASASDEGVKISMSFNGETRWFIFPRDCGRLQETLQEVTQAEVHAQQEGWSKEGAVQSICSSLCDESTNQQHCQVLLSISDRLAQGTAATTPVLWQSGPAGLVDNGPKTPLPTQQPNSAPQKRPQPQPDSQARPKTRKPTPKPTRRPQAPTKRPIPRPTGQGDGLDDAFNDTFEELFR